MKVEVTHACILSFFLQSQPHFVRQKTPHPKELKAKAHKLFLKRDIGGHHAPQHHENDNDHWNAGKNVEASGSNRIPENGHRMDNHQSVDAEYDNTNEESEEVSLPFIRHTYRPRHPYYRYFRLLFQTCFRLCKLSPYAKTDFLVQKSVIIINHQK